jgi:glycosyltransferase involved in cell wall biosynthesis
MDEGWYPHGRVALVHDFLLDVRGAERVFAAMCEVWPKADIFTPVYDEAGTEGRFAHRDVNTSFLQRLRPTSRTFRGLLPLYPYAIESFDLRGYDLVVSSSSAWAHGVIVDEHAVHVCYCHNPFRYAWNARASALSTRNPVARAALAAIFSRWRQWDWIAAQRVDRYLTNSRTTQLRIARYFGRESSVVYPPVQTGRFQPGAVSDYYLVVSELLTHKRINVAIEAFNRLGRRLVIVGDGPDTRRLRRMAGPTVEFAGRVSDARAEELLRGCRALVVPATEEFGIAAVEAQASGRPVIAVGAGGALETVVEGVTGTLYTPDDPTALAAAVARFAPEDIDPEDCRANADRFGVVRFQEELRTAVTEACAQDRPPRPARIPPWHRARARGGPLTAAGS